jgi:hypothetical protein
MAKVRCAGAMLGNYDEAPWPKPYGAVMDRAPAGEECRPNDAPSRSGDRTNWMKVKSQNGREDSKDR